MLQRLSIRGKILAVVAVPIIVLIFGAGWVVWTAINDVARSANAAQLMEVVKDGQAFNGAMRLEADAATNYVDAWTEHSAERNARAELVDQTIEALEVLAETDPQAAAALVAVNSALSGGTSMSLEAARAVAPVEPEDLGPLVWPSASDATLVSTSYTSMANAINSYAGTLPEGSASNVLLIDLARYLGQEGVRAERLLTETPAFQEAFLAAQPELDSAWSSLTREIDNVANTDQNANVMEYLTELKASLAAHDQRRGDIMNRTAGPNPTLTYYYAATGSLAGAVAEIALLVDDPRLSREIDAFLQTDRLLEEMSREDTAVDLILRAGEFAQGNAASIRTQFARTDFVRDLARVALEDLDVGFDLPNTGQSFDATSQTDYQAVRNRVSDSTGLQLQTAARQDWPTQVAEEIGVVTPYNEDTLTLAEATAAQNQRDAFVRAAVTVVGSVVVVLTSIFLALLIARRIVNPLRRLTTTATAVRQELPRLVERVALPGERVDVSEVQIPVESSDEVGRLAEAFNSVNAATLAIASEQAALRGSISEMFVNVARRDQVLLNRQLSSIDEMERTEDNPETLTRLFALDHLATRMRRNSESLLVLAGIDTGRRLRRPMPLSDVIRTASSEIELYERVQLELDIDPAMVGHSALTAAHLFAELLENATVFSDPGTPVVVRTLAEGNSYVVRITDSGIGMTTEELAEANARVASSAASEILGAQRLGLFVVGRIARRIGARIEIESAEGEGTTATVYMPHSLFDASASAELGSNSAAVVDEATHAPYALVTHDIGDEVLDASPAVASAAERAGAMALANYQPALIAEGTSLTGRTGTSATVAALLADDAAQAPVATPVDLDELTDGVSEGGLPTRRRRGSGGTEAPQATDSIIGLPARATDAQLSALEADAGSGFTPVVSASEVAPQTAEQRAAMFRGFRPRREDPEAGTDFESDAESLGQAVRRGAAVNPEDVAGSALAAVVEDPFVEGAGSSQSPLITSGYDHDEPEGDRSGLGIAGLAAAGALAIPGFADDDDDAPAPAPAPAVAALATEPVLEDSEPEALPAEQYADFATAEAGVDAVSLDDSEYPPALAPEAPAVATAAAVAAGVAASRYEPVTSSPSLDELIQGDTGEDRGGFFSKLFRRSKGAAEPSAATAMLASMPQQVQTGPGGVPLLPPQDDVALPAPAPAPEAPATSGATPAFAPSDDVDQYAAPDTGSFRARPRDPWGADEAPTGLTPMESVSPYNPGILGGEPPMYTRDDLARPLGWETAGASALQAAEPEQATSYSPMVQLDAQPVADDGDMASAAFSELNSLSSERPKVERTRAGLLKRRAADAPPVEVTPLDGEVESEHRDRDADAVRARFTSFYSGTQRARTDVEAFETSTHGSLSET